MIRFEFRTLLFALVAATAGAAAAASELSPPTPGNGPYLDDTSGPDAVDGLGTNRYLRIAGSSFVARHATTDSIFATAGCIRSSDTGAIFTADVQLPNGAVVNYVRTYYYNDGVSANIATHFTDFDGAGDSTEHTSFTTNTSTGYASTLSPQIAVTITPMTHSYSMVVVINSTSTNLRFCGVRIQYTP
ncbi:MAG TPA: hypothetical protein VLF18_05280 [Tahibacter sp.]|uniref:hypothetical protein n=1 Tax=Tahibacter sp. TaxID=2056211 RepID=UPI002C358B57|nr:hypothetical protein [Tahibacter sp.]HSX59590.1 hypothetical protein [Tahibacter sp.]